MGMRRRTLLLASLVVLPSAARAAPRRAGAVAVRRLRLQHAATGAKFSGPYHTGLAPDPGAMAELSIVLADTRTGEVRAFDPLAIEVLWEVARRTGLSNEITILSGYRTPETNVAVHGAGDSQHLRAGAVDVLLAPERLAAFGEAALGLGRGGVGIYAQRGFVHLDSGPVRRWGDVAGGTGTVEARAPVDPLARMAEAWAATRGR
jgi:uncharacterized protein YcbK (DUF882 family)